MPRCILWTLMVLVGLMVSAAPVAATDMPQYRAFWADSFHVGYKTPAQVDKLVANLHAARMNAVFMQVGRRGDCYCNHAAMPRTQDPAVPAGFDPLAYLIEKAHAADPPIEVHAWLIATAIWGSSTPPLNPAHVFNTHGPSAIGDDFWLMVGSDGSMQLGTDWHLDPGHPAAADYIVKMYTSIVQNYAVDGVNLDRIRYPDPANASQSWSYNPTSVARFNAAYGRSGIPAATDPAWQQWRRDQVTTLVRRVYLETTALNPRIKVSADTIVYGAGPASLAQWQASRTYREVFQDWVGWLNEGILDINIPMNYKREHLDASSPGACGGNQQLWYDQWDEWAKATRANRQLVEGAGSYLNYTENTVRQFRQALTPDGLGRVADGIIGYSYAAPAFKPDPPSVACGGTTVPGGTIVDSNTSVAEADAYRAQLTRQLTTADPDGLPPLFGDVVPVPPMPWKAAATSGHLMGFVRNSGLGVEGAVVRVVDRRGRLVSRATVTSTGGFYGLLDLPPGDYRVTTESPFDSDAPRARPPVHTRYIQIKPGAVTKADFTE